ncbi:exodeoxyribonuclease-5 [Roseiarcus fermentans]|uniref:Exodeoxyribonuclease-5 n=2 Tax=Roseiarcus fermentans TaxID=1473586 RepID=A0A366FIG2_9HYPH|nr:exodeoxyribonuclease-5 [Roseiarcus fermentans]
MAIGRLGTKRQCLACGAKFYDLGRKPPTCSRCGARVEPKAAPAAAAAVAAPPAAGRAKKPAAPPAPTPAPTPAREKRSGREWTREQAAAIDRVGAWLKAGEPQVFRLFGYAGVGKTTLARHVAEGADGETAFAAFTGKAAMVMRAHGCAGATTIHALIYRAAEGADGAPTFTINEDGAASRASLIVIDECSMVDAELARDLLSFGKPILVLGDPFQLPPVKGGGYFTESPPDVMLTEIHRQAEDNPIIRLSQIVRAGGDLKDGAYGESRVIRRSSVDAAQVLAADQVLVGVNRTRRAYNQRIRELEGLKQPLPAAGDRLVCLRNDRAKGLINGSLWRVEALGGVVKDFVRMTVRAEDDAAAKSVKVAVLKAFFEGTEGELAWPLRRESDEFDYGYALTVHKAQGSQWDDVLLFDESFAFREHRARWLYTGLTRAAKRLTIVR